MITKILTNIFKLNLGIKKNERVLVFTDLPGVKENMDSRQREVRLRLKCLAFLTSEIAKSFSNKVDFYQFKATGRHGAEPPRELWEQAFGQTTVSKLEAEKLLGPLTRKTASAEQISDAERIVVRRKRSSVDVVVALSYFSTSHTRFRDFLTRLCDARYASMPLFEMSMLEGPMNVDLKKLANRTQQVARLLSRSVKVHVSTDNGSELEFQTKGRKALADTGILTKPGSFGNLPAGEAFVAPVEGTAKGSLVLEWAPTRQLKSPVTLTVDEGKVKSISGSEEFAGTLRKALKENRNNSNIAEFGIGTNNMARRPDNILESEKILGTIHIALGDNSSFGGTVKTPFHQDFVFFKPTVVLTMNDGSALTLLKAGRLAT